MGVLVLVAVLMVITFLFVVWKVESLEDEKYRAWLKELQDNYRRSKK